LVTTDTGTSLYGKNLGRKVFKGNKFPLDLLRKQEY
jgi:hypothetical protein